MEGLNTILSDVSPSRARQQGSRTKGGYTRPLAREGRLRFTSGPVISISSPPTPTRLILSESSITIGPKSPGRIKYFNTLTLSLPLY